MSDSEFNKHIEQFYFVSDEFFHRNAAASTTLITLPNWHKS